MSWEVMFDIPPRHFGKRWGDEIFTVAGLLSFSAGFWPLTLALSPGSTP